MTFSIKDGVCLERVHAMIAMHKALTEVMKEYGVDEVITSGMEGQHHRASLHYIGNAIDWRTRDIPVEKREALRKEIKGRLGGEFDVTLSQFNLHVEWQPKTGVNQ